MGPGRTTERSDAPPQRRAGWPDAPETTPPMPFTEWPYGGVTSMGVTRTASADSPLMVAIANTSVGQALNAAGIQIYGWVDGAATSAATPSASLAAMHRSTTRISPTRSSSIRR